MAYVYFPISDETQVMLLSQIPSKAMVFILHVVLLSSPGPTQEYRAHGSGGLEVALCEGVGAII